MGILEYFAIVIFVVVVAYLATLFLKKAAPGHPEAFDWLLWFVAAVIVVAVLAQAMGLTGMDPKIPRFGK